MSERIDAMEAALRAVQAELRAGHDVRDRSMWASAIARAIDAYQQALPKPAVEAVRLLRVRDGDIVVFHLDDRPTLAELNDFMESLQPLTAEHPGVKFIAAERVADITVVRPEPLADAVEQARPDNAVGEAEARVCPLNWRDDTPCPVIDGGEHCCVIYRGHRENHACPCGATKDGGEQDGQR